MWENQRMLHIYIYRSWCVLRAYRVGGSTARIQGDTSKVEQQISLTLARLLLLRKNSESVKKSNNTYQ